MKFDKSILLKNLTGIFCGALILSMLLPFVKFGKMCIRDRNQSHQENNLSTRCVTLTGLLWAWIEGQSPIFFLKSHNCRKKSF